METLIIDNVGFDVKAMSEMKKDEFVKLHLDNDAICRHMDQKAKVKFLEEAYSKIKTAANADSQRFEGEPKKA